jgi:transcriptional regulator with PAS, ATPase and Fis domain
MPHCIDVVGAVLSAADRRLLVDCGCEVAGASSVPLLRVHIGDGKMSRTDTARWLWAPSFDPEPVAAARAVLAGAIAIVPRTDGNWPKQVAAYASLVAIDLTATWRKTIGPLMIANAHSSKRALSELHRASQTSMAVLLVGETGTGKDVSAQQLHRWSPRCKGPFVAINCSAIPNDLIEGELFGYVKGAFSGAVANYDGQIRAAAGGTIFLDEVDDTPPTLQHKLLRVLEDRVVSRLGENTWRPIDFRIVAATNRDLPTLVQRGEFGADLYQRLAILQIALPALRDRRDDIAPLTEHLVARFYQEEPGAPHRVTRLHSHAVAALENYYWPGNIRELRNVVFASLVAKRLGDELMLADLPEHVVRCITAPAARSAALSPLGDTVIDEEKLIADVSSGRFNLRATVEQLETSALRAAWQLSDKSATRAAKLLGEVGRGQARDPSGTVRAMLKRYNIEE